MLHDTHRPATRGFFPHDPLHRFVRGAFNAGMRGLKGSVYEGGHRIPWLARWPEGGVGGGTSVNNLTAYIDFMPTILDFCGVAAPEERGFHGRSLAALRRA